MRNNKKQHKKTSSGPQNDLEYPEVKISASLVERRVVVAERPERCNETNV